MAAFVDDYSNDSLALGSDSPLVSPNSIAQSIPGGFGFGISGGSFNCGYDATGRLTNLTDQNGGTTNFTYAGSNLASLTDPVQNTTQWSYDNQNRLTQESNGISRRELGDIFSLPTT
jgi:YD repeat-containing protein